MISHINKSPLRLLSVFAGCLVFSLICLNLIFQFQHISVLPTASNVYAATDNGETKQGFSPSSCESGVDPEDCALYETLDNILNFVAGLVVPITGILIIVGGIQYSAAQNNPEAVKNARGRIYKAVLALICFIAMWTFLQWLLPGGTLGG